MDELDIIDRQEVVNKRPVFLKVLCILTFVGSGMGITSAVISLLIGGMSEESFRILQQMDGGILGGFATDLEEMMRWQKYINFANLAGSAICLAGALMMWRLKRVGFYLYLPGALIPLTVSIFGMQHIMTGFMANIGMFSIVLSGIFTAAFIVMYGINFKHLK